MQVSLPESNIKRIIELLQRAGTAQDKLLAGYLQRQLDNQLIYTNSIDLDEIPF